MKEAGVGRRCRRGKVVEEGRVSRWYRWGGRWKVEGEHEGRWRKEEEWLMRGGKEHADRWCRRGE